MRVNTSGLPLLTAKEQTELMLKLKAGDGEAREKFIVGNMRLVLSLVKRFWAKNANADDVFQAGCVGLIKAIDNFDVSVGVKFSTYAVPMILGEIKRYLRARQFAQGFALYTRHGIPHTESARGAGGNRGYGDLRPHRQTDEHSRIGSGVRA